MEAVPVVLGRASPRYRASSRAYLSEFQIGVLRARARVSLYDNVKQLGIHINSFIFIFIFIFLKYLPKKVEF